MSWLRGVAQSLSVRAKLTLWYLAVTSSALLLFGLLSYGALSFALTKLKQISVEHREERLLLYLQEQRASGRNVNLAQALQNYVVIAHEGNLLQLRGSGGELLFPLSRGSASWLTTTFDRCDSPVFKDSLIEGHPSTVMCHVIKLNGNQARIYIGSSLEDSILLLHTYRNSLLLLLPCLLAFAAVSGYLLSKHAMRPIDRMTRAALNIGIGNLSSRLPVPIAHDELWTLVTVWNQLLDRLETAVTRLSNFSADASHDLRTSITVILATAQLSLHRQRSSEEYRENFSRIVDECRTASTLLDALLSLARSENFVHEVAIQHINIGELVVAACRRVEDLADSSSIHLDWRLPGEEVYVLGDELLLQRLLGILLDNAIKYTPRHGEIIVEASVTQADVIVAVSDTGVGISEGIRQRIFERFYQADLRERKDHAGNGLGLSIARWIAEAHHAELSVDSIPMQGSKFQIRFPRVDPIFAPLVDAPALTTQSVL